MVRRVLDLEPKRYGRVFCRFPTPSGNRTRVSPVAGAYSTTRPTVFRGCDSSFSSMSSTLKWRYIFCLSHDNQPQLDSQLPTPVAAPAAPDLPAHLDPSVRVGAGPSPLSESGFSIRFRAHIRGMIPWHRHGGSRSGRRPGGPGWVSAGRGSGRRRGLSDSECL